MLLNTHITQLYHELMAAHGPQCWWPVENRRGDIHRDVTGVPGDPLHRWEIMVGAVLTQNTSWKNVEQALQALRGAGITRPDLVENTEPSVLAELIRSSGYYNQKARKLQILAAACRQRSWLIPAARGGCIPSRKELLSLWGIGPETADCILLYAYGVPSFVIDAYTRRILSRVFSGCSIPADPLAIPYEQLQLWFSEVLPAETLLYNEYHALLVRHGADFCRAKPLCSECPLGPSGTRRCAGHSAATG
ncbi:MAG: endonuclease III domain-containing protein [Spirochaeta sp.]